ALAIENCYNDEDCNQKMTTAGYGHCMDKKVLVVAGECDGFFNQCKKYEYKVYVPTSCEKK
ncbi:hypothetical protein LDC_2787, partial [sediment metagenome]